MSTDNLYAPPGAMVGDVHAPGPVQPVKFWPPSGRIGRVRMLGWATALYLMLIAAMIVVGLFTLLTSKSGGVFGMLLLGIVYVAYSIASVSVMVQRSHDMDLSGWSVLLLLIPFVILYWLFKSGTPGVNRFGPPPPPNSTGVKVLAWLIVVPFLLGIVAAIALPAYQQYVMRAQARAIQPPPP